MRQFRLLHLSMLVSCCVLLAREGQAQAAPAGIRRLPNEAPDSHTVVPREVPVQMPQPCADTTIIFSAADTLRGVRPPILVRFPYASLRNAEWHAEFVVGTNGVPDRASVEMTRNGKPTRDGHFRNVIEKLRYQPAALGDCAVRFNASMDYTAGSG